MVNRIRSIKLFIFISLWLVMAFGGSRRLSGQEIIRIPDDLTNLQTAIDEISDGGIIEIATDLSAPSGGFDLSDLNKSLTIRAAEGWEGVTLSGNGVTNIIRSDNTGQTAAGPLVFQDLVFVDGYSDTAGISGGLMLDHVQATFIRCDFLNNISENGVVGGAVYVGDESTVLFMDCVWSGNTTLTGGAGLGIRGDSSVFIHDSSFLYNRANPPNHNANSGGGGINVGNATLRVSNSRFEANEAGGFGGGLYAIGNWLEPYTIPRTDVIVTNCTFIDNKAQRDVSVSASSPTEGGAVNAEDQTLMRIFNSRFITNSAMIGGGVNLYRSSVKIYGCTFLGNQATDTAVGSGFGGAISLTSQDGAAAGYVNYPPAMIFLKDSFIQGRYGSVTTVAQAGGGLRASGDSSRIDGDPEPPDLGTVAENLAVVSISNTVFYDCDVYKPVEGAGNGGALSIGITQFDMQDSMVINCDAFGEGPGASGGGITIMNRSVANITNTVIAGNSALKYGGGLFVQGSDIHVSNCTIINNEISPGVDETAPESYGAGIFAGPDIGRDIAVTGVIENSIISNNIGMQVFDDDRNAGPVNDVRYNGNTFYSTYFGDSVYNSALAIKQNAAGLNTLEIVRTDAQNTFKSQVDNDQPEGAPSVGALLAVPPESLFTNAPGDPVAPTESWLGYAWSGSSATLDDEQLSTATGVSSSLAGEHELLVDQDSYWVSIFDGDVPELVLAVDPQYIDSGESADLSWSTPGGAFLDCALDQGVSIDPLPSGSVQVTAFVDRSFLMMTITEEGGVTATATLYVGTPQDVIFVDDFESGGLLKWSYSVN